jgi:hypothetical protein
MTRTVLIAAVMAAGCGCASHSISPLRPPENSARSSSSTEQHGVAVSIDWRSDPGSESAHLGEVLASVGVLPVLVRLENKGPLSWNVPNAKMRLRTPDGKVENEYPSGLVADLFLEFRSSFFGDALRHGPHGWLFTLAEVPRHYAALEADRARQAEFERQALPRGPIAPGERRHGVVYFPLRDHLSSAGGATFLLPLTNASNGDVLEISLPASGAPSRDVQVLPNSRLIPAGELQSPEDNPHEAVVNCVSAGERRWVRRSRCDPPAK